MVLRTIKQRLRSLFTGPPIHIVSFPKCGRTWLRMMIGISLREMFQIHVRHPLELEEYQAYSYRIPPIYVKHAGDPFNKKPGELTIPLDRLRNSRVLFLIRDPRDVIVSSYFEKTKREGIRLRTGDDQYDPDGKFVPYTNTMPGFVRDPVGSLETLLSYYNLVHGQRSTFRSYLLIRYEHLQADTSNQLRSILRFAGFSQVSNGVLNRAIAGGSFETMRKLEEENAISGPRLIPGQVDDQESFKTRRGVVGGYRNYLSPEDIDHINLRMMDCLTGQLTYL